MPLYIFARFHARASLEGPLYRALEEVVEASRTESGCRFIYLYRSVRDAGLFFIHSEFGSAEDFEIHAELPHVRKFLSVIPDLVDHELDVNRTERVY